MKTGVVATAGINPGRDVRGDAGGDTVVTAGYGTSVTRQPAAKQRDRGSSGHCFGEEPIATLEIGRPAGRFLIAHLTHP